MIKQSVHYKGRNVCFDGDLHIVTSNFDVGDYVLKDSPNDTIHGIVSHPTRPYLVENRFYNNFISGSWKFTWSWDEGQYGRGEINDFIVSNPMKRCSTEVTSTSVTRILDNAAHTTEGWETLRPTYSLLSKVKIEALSPGTMVCVNFLNDSISKYNVSSYGIGPRENIKVQTGCYIIPCTNNLFATTRLKEFRIYEISSEEIDINNDSDEVVRLLRIEKCGT